MISSILSGRKKENNITKPSPKKERVFYILPQTKNERRSEIKIPSSFEKKIDNRVIKLLKLKTPRIFTEEF